MTPAGRAYRSWLKTLDRRVSVGVHRAPWSSDRWTRVPPRGVGTFRPWPAVDVAEIEKGFGEVCGLWARQTPSSPAGLKKAVLQTAYTIRSKGPHFVFDPLDLDL